MIKPLDQRVSLALAGSLSSAELAVIVEEVTAAAASATLQLDELKAQALDPGTSDAAAAAVRASAEALEFNVQRLHIAAARLGERHQATLAAEHQAEVDRQAVALQRMQDAARAQWDHEYPILANRIAGLAANLESAGLMAPRVTLPVRHEGPQPAFETYLPAPTQPYFKPADYAPSCSGDLLIRANGGRK